jgi:hypothetical protein
LLACLLAAKGFGFLNRLALSLILFTNLNIFQAILMTTN